jgi:hypothetical protein
MSRKDNIDAIRGKGKRVGQGFQIDLHFFLYPEGTKSRATPYLIFGLPGAEPSESLSCTSAEQLWETFMQIGAMPADEKPTSVEATRQAILNDVLAGKVRVEEVGEVTLGEIAQGDLVRHRDGKLRLAVAKLDSGWKLAELTGDRVLSGWATTTRVTLMKLVPAS